MPRVHGSLPSRRLRLVACLMLAACGVDDSVAPESLLDFTGTWNPATNFGGPFGHDGNPVASENFLVFSGFASYEARQYAADVAEEVLAEILDLYDITPAALTFLPTYAEPKIHVLAIKDQHFVNTTGFAYRDGLVTISTDSPLYRQMGFGASRYKRVIKHETVHVVEFLLIGDPAFQQASDVWWREGLANLISGPRPTTITTRRQVEDWRAAHASLPGGGNPVAVHVWSDFPQEVLEAGRAYTYYDMFELTVRFLLDPAGQGASFPLAVNVYETLGSGLTFRHALADRFGIDLGAFERDYWQIILDYVDAMTP